MYRTHPLYPTTHHSQGTAPCTLLLVKSSGLFQTTFWRSEPFRMFFQESILYSSLTFCWKCLVSEHVLRTRLSGIREYSELCKRIKSNRPWRTAAMVLISGMSPSLVVWIQSNSSHLTASAKHLRGGTTACLGSGLAFLWLFLLSLKLSGKHLFFSTPEVLCFAYVMYLCYALWL